MTKQMRRENGEITIVVK